MKKYVYDTESIGYGVSKEKLTKKLDALLNERGAMGWRLVKYDFCDWLGVCVVMFEKEVEE